MATGHDTVECSPLLQCVVARAQTRHVRSLFKVIKTMKEKEKKNILKKKRVWVFAFKSHFFSSPVCIAKRFFFFFMFILF